MNNVGPQTSPDAGRQRPDLNIGTLDDTLAGIEFIVPFETTVTEMAKKSGLTVAKNTPYSGGGYITRKYGKPEQGYHAIQLEVKKGSCNTKQKRKIIQQIIDQALSELPF